jgi:putative peptidoglycan lipid II flippase
VVTGASTELLTRVLVVFVLGLVPFSTFQLLLRAFYALQDTRTVFLVNLVAVGVNVVVDLLLFNLLPERWKIPGLALGHATSYTVGSVLLFAFLSRRVGGLEGGRILRSLGRIMVAGVAMAAIAALLGRAAGGLLEPGFLRDLVTVMVGVVAGLVSYLLLGRLLRIQELGLLLEVVRRQRSRRRGTEFSS